MEPPLGPLGTVSGGVLLDSLATLGRNPEEIDAVALTHLHPTTSGGPGIRPPAGDRPLLAGVDCLVAEPEWIQRHFGTNRASAT
jgi:hypothetical protein